MRFLGLGLRSKHFLGNGGKYIFAYKGGTYFTSRGEGKQVGFDDNFERAEDQEVNKSNILVTKESKPSIGDRNSRF